METALGLPGQPVQRGTMAHEHDVYALLADAGTRQRNLAVLEQYAPLAFELASRDEHRLYLGIARRAQGVAASLRGDPTEAKEQLAQALALFQDLGARWQVGRTLAELGEVAAAHGDEQEAQAHFKEAVSIFESMQAMPDAAQSRARLGA